LQDWVQLNHSTDSIPIISFKKEIEQIEKFEYLQKRINALEKYKKDSENPLFPVPIPEILENWVTRTDKMIEVLPERILKIKFEEDNSRVSKSKKFESEFNKFYEQYETPIKINRLYDGLHKLYYDIKGRDNIKLYFSFGLIAGT